MLFMQVVLKLRCMWLASASTYAQVINWMRILDLKFHNPKVFYNADMTFFFFFLPPHRYILYGGFQGQVLSSFQGGTIDPCWLISHEGKRGGCRWVEGERRQWLSGSMQTIHLLCVCDTWGWIHMLSRGIFQSLPSGLRLATCCPEDHPSTWNQEQAPEGSTSQEKMAPLYRNLLVPQQVATDYHPNPSKPTDATGCHVEKYINKNTYIK